MNWLALLTLLASLFMSGQGAQAQLAETELDAETQQDDALMDAAEDEEASDEEIAAKIKKRRAARLRAAAEAAAAATAGNVYALVSADGNVAYQTAGAIDWKTVSAADKRALKEQDIFKTEENSYAVFSAPGKCAFRLEESSTLMLDGLNKTPAVLTLVRGTLLVRCLPQQKLVGKNPVFRLENTGASTAMSYDFDAGVAAAAKYAVAPSSAEYADSGLAQVIRLEASVMPLVLEAGQQFSVSKHTLDAQPGEMQLFFSDFKARVAALPVPEVKKPKAKPAQKKKAAPPAAPKLEVTRFESKREQDRRVTDDVSEIPFKDRLKKKTVK